VTKFGQRMRAFKSKFPLPPLSLVADQGEEYLKEFNDLAARMSAARRRVADACRPEWKAEAEAEAEADKNLSVLVLDPTPTTSSPGLVASAVAKTTRIKRAVAACPTEDLVGLWHEHCAPPLPTVGILNDARRTALAARWREVCADAGFDRAAGLEWFRWLFSARVLGSEFLMGRAKASRDGTPFRCHWDWLMRPSNFAKVVDGNYADRKGQR
jgi:hypothetical protein